MKLHIGQKPIIEMVHIPHSGVIHYPYSYQSIPLSKTIYCPPGKNRSLHPKHNNLLYVTEIYQHKIGIVYRFIFLNQRQNVHIGHRQLKDCPISGNMRKAGNRGLLTLYYYQGPSCNLKISVPAHKRIG